MNYQKHYDLLINRAHNRNLKGYGEWHHIIPKCIGGTDLKDNLVKLTPEEHYVAHQLLVKLNPNCDELLYAANMMMVQNSSQHRSKNKAHGWLRRRMAKAMSPRMKLLHTGKKQSAEHVQKRADARRGKSGSLKGRKASIDIRNKNGRSKQVLCVETGIIYSSARKAQEETGLHVRNAARGFQKSSGGYTWKYVDSNK